MCTKEWIANRKAFKCNTLRASLNINQFIIKIFFIFISSSASDLSSSVNTLRMSSSIGSNGLEQFLTAIRNCFKFFWWLLLAWRNFLIIILHSPCIVLLFLCEYDNYQYISEFTQIPSKYQTRNSSNRMHNEFLRYTLTLKDSSTKYSEIKSDLILITIIISFCLFFFIWTSTNSFFNSDYLKIFWKFCK